MRSLCSILYGFAFGGLVGIGLYIALGSLMAILVPEAGAPPMPWWLLVFAALAAVYIVVWDIFCRKEQAA